MLAIFLGYTIALVISLLNGRTLIQALYAAAVFAAVTGIIVGVLSWAVEYAMRRGYPGWLGFILVFFLNILGIIILFLLPNRQQTLGA
jgi:hypothetical protein